MKTYLKLKGCNSKNKYYNLNIYVYTLTENKPCDTIESRKN